MKKNKTEAEMPDQKKETIQEECQQILEKNENNLQFRLAVDIICPDAITADK